MGGQYLGHLKEQQAAIEGYIKAQREADLSYAKVGLRIMARSHIHLLEDATKTLSALIGHVEPEQDTNK